MQPRTGLVGTMKTTDYEYDDKQRIRQEVVLNSDGKEYFTSYRYPDEFSGTVVAENIRSNPILCWQQLAKKHRVDQPIEVLNGFYKDDTRYVTVGRIYLHSIKDLTLRPMDSIPNLWKDTMIQMHQSIAENLCQWNITELKIKTLGTDYRLPAIDQYLPWCETGSEIYCCLPVGLHSRLDKTENDFSCRTACDNLSMG